MIPLPISFRRKKRKSREIFDRGTSHNFFFNVENCTGSRRAVSPRTRRRARFALTEVLVSQPRTWLISLRVRPVSTLITELSLSRERRISPGIYYVFSSAFPCASVCTHDSPRVSRNSLIYFSYARRRDCPGVGTSSGPAGKEISYHGNVGGTSVGYKPQPQHSPQTRGPPPHFPQESVGPPANSPPLHINICGQVNASSSVAPLPPSLPTR